MMPLEELHKIQQEYTRLLKLHPHAEVYTGIYETMGTPIDMMESEIKKLNKLIEKLKIELDSFGIIY